MAAAAVVAAVEKDMCGDEGPGEYAYGDDRAPPVTVPATTNALDGWWTTTTTTTTTTTKNGNPLRNATAHRDANHTAMQVCQPH
jgi:hypothetical protein